MTQTVNLKAKGLYDYPNTLGSVPDGALVLADNIIIDADGVIQPRRGFEPYGNELPVPADNTGLKAFIPYQDSLIVNYDNFLGYDSGNGVIVNYPITYAQPTYNHKIRAVEANRNLYFTSNEGIMKLDSITATPVAAGVVKALSGDAQLVDSSGFLADDNAVAYRMTWSYTDVNDNFIEGAPSSRVVIGNSSGSSKNVELTFYIPDSITTDYSYRIFRSKSSTVEPDDDMYLVAEGNVSNTDLTNGYFTIVDTVSDSLQGEALYTSPSQEQIQNANDTPPFATDLAYYKNSVFFANTRTKQRFNLSLLGTGGSLGLQLDDTITIAGVVYTAKATEDAANGYFQLFTLGTPGTNIENTARSLEKIINLTPSNNSVYAYYASNYNEVPGKLLIEEREINSGQFSVNSSRPDVWNPVLPTSGSSVHSTNDSKPNGVFISKALQPEAVPVFSFLSAGSANKEIKRINVLKDSMIIWKDDGIFRLTGEGFGNFTIQEFEPSTKLLVINSAVVLNNRVFAYTTQGIVAVSDSGTEIISRPIEGTLLRLATYPAFSTASFGIAYESDRKYIFFTVTKPTDAVATQAFIYNYLTNAWTRWDEFEIEQITAGIVNPANDKLYLGGVGGID